VGTGFCAYAVVFWIGYDIAHQTCRGSYLLIVCPEAEPEAKAIA
jgi:hypothetical protein